MNAGSLQRSVEQPGGYPQVFENLGLLTVVGIQVPSDDTVDEPVDGLVQALLQRKAVLLVRHEVAAALFDQGRGQKPVDRVQSDAPIVAGHEQVDELLEFADIARPVVLEQALLGVGGEAEPFASPRVIGDQGNDVALPLREGTQLDGKAMDALEEIEAQLAGLDKALEVLQRRADDAELRGLRMIRAKGVKGLLLDGLEQLRLHLEAHGADLVQKQGALVRREKLSLAGLIGSGESALPVAEELGLEKVLGVGRAVDRDELAGPAGMVVDDPRQARLARSRWSQEEDGQIRRGVLERFPDRGARGGVLGDEPLRKENILVGQLAALEKSRDDAADVGFLVAFGVKVVATKLVGSLHELLGVVAGHDDRVDAFGFGERDQFQTRGIPVLAQLQVDEAQIVLGAVELLSRARHVRREVHGVAAQLGGHDLPGQGIVLNDEYGEF